jgi:hypothetical protein
MSEEKKVGVVDFVLPTKPTKSKLINPSPLLVFGKPKIGKTTTIAALENNLVINLEDKVQTADGMIMYAKDLATLRQILTKIKEAGNPYKYLTIDTLTKLEEFCIPEAEKLYMKTPMGSTWIVRDPATKEIDKKKSLKYKYGNIIFLPNGSGYQYVRQAFQQLTTLIESCAENIIYIAHVKDTNILKDGLEFVSSDINLIGKNKQSISAAAQAIAFMSRTGGKNYLYFQPGEDILTGCKIKRLDGQEILISEYDDKGNFITHWDKVYLPTGK